MSLRDLRGLDAERGYAMAALLVALAVMAILLSAAMPVWRHEAQREKEAELIFRGEQYARAIALFKFKNANIPNAFPPSIDSLIEGRYLRKKYKDPMTKDGEFVVVGGMSTNVGGAGTNQPGFPAPQGGRSNSPTPPAQPGQFPGAGGQGAAGMIGVRSKSEETSIRSYRGATRYDQWQFTFNTVPRPGGAMPMANSPDGRGFGGPGGNPNFPGRGGNPNFPGPGGNRGGRDGQGGPGRIGGPGTLNPPPFGTPPSGGAPPGRGSAGRGVQPSGRGF